MLQPYSGFCYLDCFYIGIFGLPCAQILYCTGPLGSNYRLYDLATLSVYPADVRAAFKYQCVCHDCSDYSGHWYSLTFAIFILQHEGRNLYYELQRQIFSGHVSVPDFIRELPIIGKEVTRTLKS